MLIPLRLLLTARSERRGPPTEEQADQRSAQERRGQDERTRTWQRDPGQRRRAKRDGEEAALTHEAMNRSEQKG